MPRTSPELSGIAIVAYSWMPVRRIANQLAELAFGLSAGEPIRRQRPALRAERALHEPALDPELAVPGLASARGWLREQRSRAVGAPPTHARRGDDDKQCRLDEELLDMHVESLLTPPVRPALGQLWPTGADAR